MQYHKHSRDNGNVHQKFNLAIISYEFYNLKPLAENINFRGKTLFTISIKFQINRVRAHQVKSVF